MPTFLPPVLPLFFLISPPSYYLFLTLFVSTFETNIYIFTNFQDKHPYSQYNWHNISVCEVAPQQDLGLGPLFCFRVSTKSGPQIFATPVEEECDAWIDAIASIETCSLEL